MSILLDKLIKELNTSITSQAKDLKWYLAKPTPFKSIKTTLNRIKDGFKVINGKSFAVHYKQDE
jgi:hypothetical protein